MQEWFGDTGMEQSCLEGRGVELDRTIWWPPIFHISDVSHPLLICHVKFWQFHWSFASLLMMLYWFLRILKFYVSWKPFFLRSTCMFGGQELLQEHMAKLMVPMADFGPRFKKLRIHIGRKKVPWSLMKMGDLTLVGITISDHNGPKWVTAPWWCKPYLYSQKLTQSHPTPMNCWSICWILPKHPLL